MARLSPSETNPHMSQALLERTLEEYRVYQTPHRTTYLLPVFVLKDLGISRWSRQRPPAAERVQEIATWIRTHQEVVGVLSLAWHPQERLICYDGQHRFQALLEQEHTDLAVMVDIMWNATGQDIVAAFQAINRAVPVSELYTDPTETLHSIKGEIASYVSHLATTYKAFLSSSAKPCRPNMNRDQLAESLFHLWRDDLQEAVPFSQIVTALTRLNETYDADQESIPRQRALKFPAIHKKCTAHRFWLFAETGRLSVEDVKRVLATGA